MEHILLQLHSMGNLDKLNNFFSKKIKEIFNINDFTVIYYNEQDFSYKILLSTIFPQEHFFYDAEIENSTPFFLEFGDRSIKVSKEISFTTEDGIIFKMLIHDDIKFNKNLEIFFKHYVVESQKLTLLKYYQNSIVISKLQLDFLNQIGEIIGSLDLEIVLTKILEGAVNIVDGDVGVIFLKDDDKFEEKISWGVPKGVIQRFKNKFSNKSIIEEVFTLKEPIIISDTSQNTEYEFELQDKYLIKSIVGIPLYTKNKNLGVLVLVNIEIDVDFMDVKLSTLETLTKIAAIGIENAIFFKDSIEKEKLKHQIKVASELQKNLFPQEDIITSNFYIGGFSLPAMNVGGDFYNYLISEDNSKIIGFVGDVAGKGIPAALLTSMSMILIKTLVNFNSNLCEVIGKINNIISNESIGEKYFTLGIFIIDLLTKKMTLVNAGHTDILIFSNREKKVKKFPSNNLPIGMFEDIEYEGYDYDFSEGDILLNFSDGILDAINENGERYELDRLINLIEKNYSISPKDLKDLILNDVKKFCGKAQQFDDLTLLLFKLL